MKFLTIEQKKKLKELKIQLQTEGINLSELWKWVQASANMFVMVGIVLFMFPDGRWYDDYINGFAVGAFLVFMMVSPNVIHCAKWVLRKGKLVVRV